MTHKQTILIIEDEAAIAENLIHVLEMDGYLVHWFDTGGAGLAFLQQNNPDLLVLDVGLPDKNGFELCKTIREFSDVPIIFLTARNDELDRVVGLEIGADDYVTKPFSPREMLARIKLRMKVRPASLQSHPEKINQTDQPQKNSLDSDHKNNPLVADNFDYFANGKALGLTAVEFKILDKLMSVSSNILSREQLMVAADMAVDAVYERNIDTHIKAIRHKLKPFSMQDRICTKRGFGYFYSAPKSLYGKSSHDKNRDGKINSGKNSDDKNQEGK